MRPESAPEHGSKLSSTKSKNSSSEDILNRKGRENVLARCSLAFTNARISSLLAESERDLATSFCAFWLLIWKKFRLKVVPFLIFRHRDATDGPRVNRCRHENVVIG